MRLPKEKTEELRQLAERVRKSPGATHEPRIAEKIADKVVRAGEDWDSADSLIFELEASDSVDGHAWRYAARKMRRAAENLRSLPEYAESFCTKTGPKDFGDFY